MTTEKQFDSILLKFLLDEPFFATIIRGMQKNRTTEIETAGVSYQDGTMKLFWNPNFLTSLKRVWSLRNLSRCSESGFLAGKVALVLLV